VRRHGQNLPRRIAKQISIMLALRRGRFFWPCTHGKPEQEKEKTKGRRSGRTSAAGGGVLGGGLSNYNKWVTLLSARKGGGGAQTGCRRPNQGLLNFVGGGRLCTTFGKKKNGPNPRRFSTGRGAPHRAEKNREHRPV